MPCPPRRVSGAGFVRRLPRRATRPSSCICASSRRRDAADRIAPFASFAGDGAVDKLLARGVDVACIATPDDRHRAPAQQALAAGKHVLIEKPSVLALHELDELDRLAREKGVLAKV